VAEPWGYPEDPYDALGVSPLADAEQIHRAYRLQARRYHPDTNPGDPEAARRFAELTTAYELLRDDARRRGYDLRRAVAHGPRAARSAPGPTGNTSVRGPDARPSHHVRETLTSAPRTSGDELAVVRTLAKVGVVFVIVVALAILAMSLRQPPACGPTTGQPCRVVESPAGG